MEITLPVYALGIAFVGFCIWLATLIHHLRRDDLNDRDAIVWTIVLCSLNILGALLYACLAPDSPRYPLARSEQALKDRFNAEK